MARRKNTSTEIKAATSDNPTEAPAIETPTTPEVASAEPAPASVEPAKIEQSVSIEMPMFETPAIDAPAATASSEPVTTEIGGPIPTNAGMPESETPQDIRLAATQAPRIEIPADAVKATDEKAADEEAERPERPIFPIAREADANRWRRNRSALLAASVALAAIVGGAIGAAATMNFAQPTPTANAAADQTQALQQTVAKLSQELHALKSGLDSAGRSATAQFNRLAERLDRAEKAQAEPAAKLARIAEALDRLERRPATAAAAAAPHATTPARAGDVTGSITTIEKSQAKPPVVEGWRLRDFYAGRAILENSSNRTLYDIGPGSVLPGLGKIEQIKRIQNQVTVVTPRGIITAELAPMRRSPYYGPYR